jgi:hypothetical protein
MQFLVAHGMPLEAALELVDPVLVEAVDVVVPPIPEVVVDGFPVLELVEAGFPLWVDVVAEEPPVPVRLNEY